MAKVPNGAPAHERCRRQTTDRQTDDRRTGDSIYGLSTEREREFTCTFGKTAERIFVKFSRQV